jgi:phosphohistidine phosphatase
MKLLIVRHAVALERDEWKKLSSDDRERPLTEEGAKKMKKAAKGLKAILGEEPECLITSPLLRAKQTADIVSNEMPSAKLVESETLAPEKEVEEFTRFLKNSFTSKTTLVACVGHEPHLNHLVAWLVSKSRNGIGELKKGGACLIEFSDEIAAGKGELRWLLTSRQLRDYPLT